MAKRLQDRVAIITGAAHGIGLAIARRLVAEGAKVVIADIDRKAGEEAIQAIRASEGEAIFQPTDVTDEEAIARLIAVTIEQYARLDILVNNAGITLKKPVLDLTRQDWQRLVDVNLTSMIVCSRLAASHLEHSDYGVIVNVASVHAYLTDWDVAAYAATKGGIVALTRGLALEFAPAIRVNTVVPGLIETDTWRKSAKDLDAIKQKRLAHHPLGRIGQPEDVAGAVAFLVSDDARFVTGTALTVDGGLSIQLYPG